MENNLVEKRFRSSDGRARKILRIIGMVFVGLIFAVLFALDLPVGRDLRGASSTFGQLGLQSARRPINL